MDLVKTLIAKAAEKLGSQAALARELGVHRSQITNWKSGTDKCQAADLAAIAYLAGFNAMNVLAATTLKEHEGTQKGAVLNAALGKEIQRFLQSNDDGLTEIKGGIAKKHNVALCIKTTEIVIIDKKTRFICIGNISFRNFKDQFIKVWKMYRFWRLASAQACRPAPKPRGSDIRITGTL